MVETLQQYFHRVYPDHCARICEEMHKNIPHDFGAKRLSEPRGKCNLMGAFLWDETPEGWEYWARLSRAEDNPMNEAFIQECTDLAMD